MKNRAQLIDMYLSIFKFKRPRDSYNVQVQIKTQFLVNCSLFERRSAKTSWFHFLKQNVSSVTSYSPQFSVEVFIYLDQSSVLSSFIIIHRKKDKILLGIFTIFKIVIHLFGNEMRVLLEKIWELLRVRMSVSFSEENLIFRKGPLEKIANNKYKN